MKSLLLSGIAGILLLSACSDHKSEGIQEKVASSNFSLDSVRAQIQASNALYGDYFAKKDSTGFISAYTNDACINPTGFPRICGSSGIGSFFNEGVKMGIQSIKLTIDEVMGGPEAVVETGKYEIIGANNVSVEKGKYIVMWKQENGKWKMHRDQWNSDGPPPVATK